MTATTNMTAIRLYKLSRFTVKFKVIHLLRNLGKARRGAVGMLGFEDRQALFLFKFKERLQSDLYYVAEANYTNPGPSID